MHRNTRIVITSSDDSTASVASPDPPPASPSTPAVFPSSPPIPSASQSPATASPQPDPPPKQTPDECDKNIGAIQQSWEEAKDEYQKIAEDLEETFNVSTHGILNLDMQVGEADIQTEYLEAIAAEDEREIQEIDRIDQELDFQASADIVKDLLAQSEPHATRNNRLLTVYRAICNEPKYAAPLLDAIRSGEASVQGARDKQLKKIKQEMDRVNGYLEQTKDEHVKTRNELASLEVENDRKITRINELTRDLNEQKDKHEANQAGLMTELTEVKQKVTEQAKKIQTTEDELNASVLKVQGVEAKLVTALSDLADAQENAENDRKDAEQKAQDSADQLRNVQSELTIANKDLQSLNEKLSDAAKDLSSANEAVKTTQTERDNIAQEKKEVQEDLNSAMNDLRTAKAKVMELENEPKFDQKTADENAKLKEELQAEKQSLAREKSALSSEKSKVPNLQDVVDQWVRNSIKHTNQVEAESSLESIRVEHQTSTTQLTTLQEEKKKLQSEIEKGRQETSHLSNKHTESESQRTTLQNDLHALQNEKSGLQGQYDELQKSNRQLTSEIEQIRQSLQTSNSENTEKQRQLANAGIKARDDENQIKATEDKHVAAVNKIQEQTDQIRHLEAALAREEELKRDAQSHLANLQSQLDVLRGQDQANRDSAQTEIAQANTDRATALTQLQELATTNTQTKQELAKLTQVANKLVSVGDDHGITATVADGPTELSVSAYRYRETIVQSKAKNWVHRLQLHQQPPSVDRSLTTATRMLLRATNGLCPSYNDLSCIVQDMTKSYSSRQLIAYLECCLENLTENTQVQLDSMFVIRVLELLEDISYNYSEVSSTRVRFQRFSDTMSERLGELSLLQKTMIENVRLLFDNGGERLSYVNSLTSDYHVGDTFFIRDGQYVLVVEHDRIIQLPIENVCYESCEKEASDGESDMNFDMHIYVVNYPATNREMKLHFELGTIEHNKATKYFEGMTLLGKGSDQC